MNSQQTLVNVGRKHAYVARNRASLLFSAQQVLADRGAEATIEEFASSAGMAVSTIYKHFANRDELIKAAVVAAMDEWESWMLSVTADLTDPLEQLVLPLRLFLKMPKTHPLLARVAVNSPQAIRDITPRLGAGFATNVKNLVASGILSSGELESRIPAVQAVILRSFEISVAEWPKSEKRARGILSVGLELIGLSPQQREHLMKMPLPAVGG